uniref:Uncharacterized protein n=1 Tax=viral metagenome TaxID=1070528 RepID=A0A6C0CL22_9ZZZZ
MISHRYVFQHTVGMEAVTTFGYHTIVIVFNNVKANWAFNAVHFRSLEERELNYNDTVLCMVIKV